MAQVQITDVVIPEEFTAYQVENSLVSTALSQSGVVANNGLIEAQLQAGAESFNIPFWADLSDTEADITSDDPTVLSTPQKISASKQVVRKSYLHQSWSEMSLASELSGSDALARVQSRVSAYWDRQYEKRLISTLLGVLASNVANNGSDMVVDISGLSGSGSASAFNGASVIDTALTMGDRLGDVKMIAMHSKVYGEALKNNEIEFYKPSENDLSIALYKGMATIVDDNLTPASGVYTTILMGAGAIGFGASAPRTGYGTELFRVPAAGNGGGQTVLHSRMNSAIHPLGYAWTDGTGGSAIAGDSPSIADLAVAAHSCVSIRTLCRRGHHSLRQ
jgi:hypothetical protein